MKNVFTFEQIMPALTIPDEALREGLAIILGALGDCVDALSVCKAA